MAAEEVLAHMHRSSLCTQGAFVCSRMAGWGTTVRSAPCARARGRNACTVCCHACIELCIRSMPVHARIMHAHVAGTHVPVWCVVRSTLSKQHRVTHRDIIRSCKWIHAPLGIGQGVPTPGNATIQRRYFDRCTKCF
jgi:hypothetical protein